MGLWFNFPLGVLASVLGSYVYDVIKSKTSSRRKKNDAPPTKEEHR
ncbi:MAG: hypothetical protein FWG90_09110 [Oscillospiraceae bacterium]|nr:hypothetical protein [Oscillospiraceae bacterium]